jgi:ribosome-associated toxin RatA of RatAB toxin-antitoxin module
VAVEDGHQEQRGGRGLRAIAGALAILAVAGLAPLRAAAESQDVESTIEVDAPLEVVWHVLTDFASWPRFVPNLKHIDVLGSAEQPTALRYQTESIGISVDFTARTDVRADLHRLDLALDESAANDITAMRASWQLTALGDGRVRIQFRSEVESGQPVPQFIQRRVVRESVEATIRNFTSEVERRVKGAAGDA